ncbi:MAG: ABC transporter permease [Chloroflexi bacterium]|nr:ABC transporter permease [Chloroflexota bacterium]
MKPQLRPLFWIEALLGLGNAALLVITVLWKDWIELVFNVDPDAGTGTVEWAVVSLTLLLTIVFVALARAEWRRSRSATVSA